MQQKSAFSTPSNTDEKENCQVQKVQPSKEVSGNELKMKHQMKMLNDLLSKLAATKANAPTCSGNALQQMSQSPFLMKPKSFICPKKAKMGLLGKRTSFNQQKESHGAVQQIYQPIPKRTKLDSPGVQAVQSELSEKSSGTRKNEQGIEALRMIKQQMTEQAAQTKQGQVNPQHTILQLLKNSQLHGKAGDKSQLKLQTQAKSSPLASNLYQLLLTEK